MWQLFVVCLSCIYLAESLSVSEVITKCKADDVKCLTESMAKAVPMFATGIPDFNVGVLDPLEIKRINATNNNLRLIVKNIVVDNIRSCKAKELKRDAANSKLMFKVLCPDLNVEGIYTMDGQLFVLPIKGNGGLHVKIEKLLFNIEVDHEDFDDDEGVKHWKIKSWKHTFELQGKSNVKFDNLFPDNEFLRTTTNDLIANNGNDVINEIGAPIIRSLLAKVVKNVERFFGAVPLKDLVLE